jgi:hypothetical protein
MQRESSQGYITRAPRSSGLADVLEILLDRGLVIDAYVRVSLVGIELLTIDLRVVIASVDTYLRFAEAVDRLELAPAHEPVGLPELGERAIESTAKHVVENKLDGPAEKVKDVIAAVRGRRRDDDG